MGGYEDDKLQYLTRQLERLGINPNGYGERIGETREEHVARILKGDAHEAHAENPVVPGRCVDRASGARGVVDRGRVGLVVLLILLAVVGCASHAVYTMDDWPDYREDRDAVADSAQVLGD